MKKLLQLRLRKIQITWTNTNRVHLVLSATVATEYLVARTAIYRAIRTTAISYAFVVRRQPRRKQPVSKARYVRSASKVTSLQDTAPMVHVKRPRRRAKELNILLMQLSKFRLTIARSTLIPMKHSTANHWITEIVLPTPILPMSATHLAILSIVSLPLSKLKTITPTRMGRTMPRKSMDSLVRNISITWLFFFYKYPISN